MNATDPAIIGSSDAALNAAYLGMAEEPLKDAEDEHAQRVMKMLDWVAQVARDKATSS